MCGEENLSYVLGVDIGGTKVAAAVMGEGGKVITKTEVPSNASDKEKMFAQVVKSVEDALATAKLSIEEISGMGVGVAGKVDYKNGVAVYQNNLPWENFPLAQRLKDYFLIENVVVDNDVTMAAFAEWQAAGMTEEETFVYLTVSTGISCATIHNGSYIRGGGFSGEIGLFPVMKAPSAEGLERLEQVSSGPAIQRTSNETPEDFFFYYSNSSEEGKEILREVVIALAHGIYAIICLIDPHKIVIGGGVFNHQPHLLELVKEALKAHLIPAQMDSLNRLQLSQLKGNSGVVGAGFVGKSNRLLFEI